MRRLPLLALALATGTAVAAGPRAFLQLVPEARVSNAGVVLGDIARLRSDDLDLLRRLVNLPVGQAPQPGQSALVRRQALEDWLHRTAGVAPDSLQWSGAEAARVIRASRMLRGEEIADAAMEAVRIRLGASAQYGDLHVRVPTRDVELPDGKVQLLPRPMDAGVALRHRALVWVDAWVGDRFIRSFPVTVEIAGGAGDISGDAATGSRRSAPVADVHATGADGVARGEWAALRTTSGAVSLENRVEVLQDGRVGQRVRVRTSANAAGVLFAKVIGRGQLELAP